MSEETSPLLSPRILTNSVMRGESSPELTSREVKSEPSYVRRVTYGVGHVFNDLCASMWFTYFLLFYHLVLQIPNTYAGLLVLIGQVADALTTPVVGYLCDTTNNRYGGRKTWHLIGTAMVALSLFFFWHQCIYCSKQPLGYQILYFSCFIIVFQAGWATVQVSHLSLIPSLTSNESIRVELNSIRYAFTVIANCGVFITILILLAVVNGPAASNGYSVAPTGTTDVCNVSNRTDSNGAADATGTKITPNDQWIFSGTALGIIVIGCIFASIFHIGTKEPPRQPPGTHYQTRLPWYRWFLNPQFYLVAIIYMCSRLIVNLTQVYTPLYMYDTLHLYRLSAAIIPFVIFISGLVATVFLRLVNYLIGRYASYCCGLVLVWIALIWFRFWPDSLSCILDNITINLIYIAGILIGVGGTMLLVTSLSMVADLIGDKTESSAFVYGAMSFTDKLSSGIAIQIIQAVHPCKGTGDNVCCSACTPYYRCVLTYVPGGASLVALIMVAVLIVVIQIRKHRAVMIKLTSSEPGRHRTIQHGNSLSSNSHTERTPY